MARRKKNSSRRENGGLIAVFSLLLPLSTWSAPFKLGKITQAEGEITHLDFSPPFHKLSKVKKNKTFFTEGSYLTQDESYLTVKLFDGSWIRLSPRSKISADYDPEAKQIMIHLFSGSIKTLFSISINHLKVEKLVIKSADAMFETVDGKFTVVRNPLTDTSSVYVEKGVVTALHQAQSSKSPTTVIHAQETTFLQDRGPLFSAPRKMTDKELKYLKPAYYIQQKPDGI